MVELEKFSLVSDKGPYLSINEDGAVVDVENQLYFLCDGFGGSNIGDKYVARVEKKLNDFYNGFITDPDKTLPYLFDPQYLLATNIIQNALIHSHKDLLEENSSRKSNEKGGVAGVFATLSDDILSLLSIGNCKCYLLRDGSISLLNQVQTFSDFSNYQYKDIANTLPLSGLGVFEHIKISVREVRLKKDDVLMLLSDGIYGKLNETELMSVMLRPGINFRECLDKLIYMANAKGNKDNQSGVILKFS